MSFAGEAWTRIGPLYRSILALPFNQELAAGTLARERFVFYILQDAHYLTYFARALAVTAARAPDNDALIQFASSASEAVVVERALHAGFFERFGVPAAEAATTEPSPTCAHYTHYLLALAHNAPYEVSVAALLPCFWIYWEVGKHLLEIARPANPYQSWIDTYADEAFATGVRKVIAISDRVAAATTPAIAARMHAAFDRASQLEWMFWDSAYRLERWPVSSA
jgi:thiaminase (transcriptional activator TenA)